MIQSQPTRRAAAARMRSRAPSRPCGAPLFSGEAPAFDLDEPPFVAVLARGRVTTSLNDGSLPGDRRWILAA